MSRRRVVKRYGERSIDNREGRVVGYTFGGGKGGINAAAAAAAPPERRQPTRSPIFTQHTHTLRTQQTIAALFSFFIFFPFLSDRPSRLLQVPVLVLFLSARLAHARTRGASRSVSLAPLPPDSRW